MNREMAAESEWQSVTSGEPYRFMLESQLIKTYIVDMYEGIVYSNQVCVDTGDQVVRRTHGLVGPKGVLMNRGTNGGSSCR